MFFNPVETPLGTDVRMGAGEQNLHVKRHSSQCPLNSKTLKVTYISRNRKLFNELWYFIWLLNIIFLNTWWLKLKSVAYIKLKKKNIAMPCKNNMHVSERAEENMKMTTIDLQGWQDYRCFGSSFFNFHYIYYNITYFK